MKMVYGDSTTYKTLFDIKDSIPIHIKYVNSVPVTVGVPIIVTTNDDAGSILNPSKYVNNSTKK